MGRSSIFHDEADFTEIARLEKYMKQFSENGYLSLNFENFKNLLSNLITNSQGKPYDIPLLIQRELFDIFDRNKDGLIDIGEFSDVCNNFIKPLIKPVCALLVIDVQNDFIDGSLALKNCPAKQDGKDVIPVINNLLEKHKFDIIVYSCDYHPENHISFIENVHLYKLSDKSKPVSEINIFDTVVFEGPPAMTQKLWPTHCVQNSWGSELHVDLKLSKNSIKVFKGTNSTVDSYSAFFDNMRNSKTILHDELKKKHVSHVFICGLAFDYCVSSTAQDAIDLGYATVVLHDATRGTDNINIKSAEDKLKSLNCVLSHSDDTENLITGKDIRAEFVYALLETLKLSNK